MLTALPTPPIPLLAPSLNLASPTPRSFGIALFVLLVFLFARLLVFPSRKKPLSLTELNTLLNRHENGGTGVWARKLRRALLPPTKWGDEEELEGAGIDDGQESDGKQSWGEWTVKSTPAPSGLKGCLKRVEQFEAALRSAVDAVAEAAEEDVVASPSPSPSPSASSAPSLPSRTASPAPKRVRIAEPSLDELQGLRELWASPEMLAEGGNGGIGGYRRTRDFYSKSQGGKAVIKGAEKEKEKEKGKDEKAKPATTTSNLADELASTSRRNPRLTIPSSAPSPSFRSASLSPAPSNRRPLHVRTLSPSKLSTSSSSAQRRRALSPVVPPGSARSVSLPPSVDRAAGATSPTQASAVPRWVKTRSGRVASPAPVGRRAGSNDGSSGAEGEESEEEEEEVEEFEDAPSPSSSTRPSPLSILAAAANDVLEEAGDTSLDSPTPSLISTQPLSAPSAPSPVSPTSPPPSVVVSPSTPPGKTLDLPLVDLAADVPSAPAAPPAPSSLAPSSSSSSAEASPTPASASSASSASTTSTAASSTRSASPSPSPSPCVQKERRLSLRVQQALGTKKERQREQQAGALRQAVEA
ncbi:hypothetical protein JCM6882_007170 [Rhodosporidiobolus microsporus]